MAKFKEPALQGAHWEISDGDTLVIYELSGTECDNVFLSPDEAAKLRDWLIDHLED